MDRIESVDELMILMIRFFVIYRKEWIFGRLLRLVRWRKVFVDGGDDCFIINFRIKFFHILVDI